MHRWSIVFCSLVAAIARPLLLAQATEPTASGAVKPATQTVVAGKEFDRSGHWRFWFGEGYRKAWATPVAFPCST